MPFEIISKIASGTFGTVYKVQDSTNGEFYALKLIHENYKVPKELKRIKRGFKSAQKVSSPNCVKMIEWFEEEDKIGFLMEFVEGEPIFLERQNLVLPQNFADIINQIIQICNGLEALHSKGIIHRDLKPANILVTKEGKIKITDFDLVKIDDSSTLTATGAFLGTIKYASPEQCQNSASVDHRSDLYSVGVLFYKMVTGKVPFDGDSLAEIALGHIRTPLISPQQFVHDLPKEIDSVITKLLKKNPQKRFSSAQEVAKTLNSFLKNDSIFEIQTFGEMLLIPDFVGRSEELSILRRNYSKASKSNLRIVLISGEQGIGKTKLWNEFKASLNQKNTTLIEVKCEQNNSNLSPLKIILTNALDKIKNLSSEEQAEKIGKFGKDLVKIFPELENKRFFKHLPELHQLKENDAEIRLFEALTIFIDNILKKDTTLVLFFDNLQWIDSRSQNWLKFFSQRLSKKAILVVGAIRDKESLNFKNEFNSAKIIELERFNLEEVKNFLTKMLGKSEPVNTKFVNEILKRTSGNVLFLEELMFHLLETKKLKKTEGIWDLDEESFSELSLPESIQSVVNERLSFLENELFQILELGTLLGKHFTTKAVASIFSKIESEVNEKLTDFGLEGILEKNEDGFFEFINDTFRESLQNQIAPKKREILHKQIGEYLENHFEESEVLEELANHFFKAKNKIKALNYCIKAGEIAKSKQVISKVEYFYKLASKVVESSEEKNLKIKIFDELAKTYFQLNKFENAIPLYEKALDLVPELNPTRANLLSDLGETFLKSSDFENAKTKFYEAFSIYENLEFKKQVGLTHTKFGILFKEVGSLEYAISSLKLALDIGVEIGSNEIIANSYRKLGEIAILRNEETAEEYLLKCLEIRKIHNNKYDLFDINCILGNYYTQIGKLKLGIDFYTESLSLAKEIGYPKGVINANVGIGKTNFIEGNYQEAIIYFKDNVRFTKLINDKKKYTEYSILLATAYNYVGEFEQSEKIFIEQKKICEPESNNEIELVSLYTNYSEMLVDSNQNEKAIEIANKAYRICKSLKLYDKLCQNLVSKINAYFELGDFINAEKICKEALSFSDKTTGIISSLLKFYKIKIDFKLHDKSKAFNQFLELQRKEESEFIVALINFEICNIASKNEYPFLLEYQINFLELKQVTLENLKYQFMAKPKFRTKKIIEKLESLVLRSKEIYPELITALANWMNPETVFDELLKFLQKETNADGCQIILQNGDDFEIVAVSPNLKEIEVNFSATVLTKAISDDQPTLLKNVLEIPELNKNESVIGKIFLSVIAVPLKADGKIIGALYLDRTKIANGFFTNSDLEKVKTFAKILSPVLQRQNEAAKLKIRSEIHKLGIFVGNSPKMQTVYSEIEKASKFNFPIYIYGETGTGKELVAEALHKLSNRRNKPFIIINCATVPTNLAESELFGHEKGAFTGANSTQKGKFELSSGGTLFLDEIGDLPLELQAKFLRAIQKKEIWKVGGTSAIKIDLRIIVATHKNLEEEVKKGNFREDLFHRLNVVKISVPSLRERIEDIPLLANHFLQVISKENGIKSVGFTSEALIKLQQQFWSGNVRELSNTIIKAIVGHDFEKPLTTKDFDFLRKPSKILKASEFEEKDEAAQKNDLKEVLNFFEGQSYTEKLMTFEKALIEKALKENDWNKTKVAEELGIGRTQVNRIIQRLKIEK
ncbi:MAG: GAF domain-containing protein [Calditrichaeota bacterium]|nr:MAG: GAF domain-containing protein [Calditrichota bacterium]